MKRKPKLKHTPSMPSNRDATRRCGMVVSIFQGKCRVECDDELLDCILPREIAQSQQTELAVGDDVILQCSGVTSILRQVQPRKSLLSRRDPRDSRIQRVIAANIDTAVIVVSVKTPPLRLKLIDRYLIAAQAGGVEPVICVNKVDLLGGDTTELQQLQPYCEMGVDVVHCSAELGQGVDELVERLSGKLCVFVGHSGVGKSSLLNALDPELGLHTNATRRSDGKGRHTTTSSTLHTLREGIRIIDTPGIREFGLWNIDAEDLKTYFPEFEEHASACRYSDCCHTTEPNCGVRTAVRDRLISRARYESYCRLLGDVAPENAGNPPDLPEHGGSFTCANCGEQVALTGVGSEHRNHCPRCLHSVHLDHLPGDRASCCGGLMEPVAVWVRKGGEWAIIHRCRDCGELSSNRIGADDNDKLLLFLAVRPLSMPPFPLDRL